MGHSFSVPADPIATREFRNHQPVQIIGVVDGRALGDIGVVVGKFRNKETYSVKFSDGMSLPIAAEDISAVDFPLLR